MELINTISSSRIWTRHGLKIAYGVSALLLLASLASVAWNIRNQSQVKTSNYAQQKIAPISNSSKHTYRVNDIVRANLFGDPTPAPVARVVTATRLDLTLQGILSASDNNIARAIIKSGKGKSGLYSVGESIKGAGVSIEEIKATEVLLNRNGAIESLLLASLKSSDKDQPIISYSSGQVSQPRLQTASAKTSSGRSSGSRPRSANGEPRKIKKPNFSGLDRALQKMGEI